MKTVKLTGAEWYLVCDCIAKGDSPSWLWSLRNEITKQLDRQE